MEQEAPIVNYVMPHEVSEDLASKIKTDLTTSSLTQAQIALKHNTSIIAVNNLNTGKLFPWIEPITETQKTRTKNESDRVKIQSTPAVVKPKQLISHTLKGALQLEIDLNDAKEMDWFIGWLHKKPGWPKIIIVPTEQEEDKNWGIAVLKDRLDKIHLEVAKTTLIIHALKTGDYSNLSEKMIVQLEQDCGHLRDDLSEAAKHLT